MMNVLPRSITWKGHGMSRLCNVSFPEAMDIAEEKDYANDEQEVIDADGYIHIQSSPITIRKPVSLKSYRKPLPTLVVRKRTN
jgi:hypothetical protein